jgi:hypothetical protein
MDKELEAIFEAVGSDRTIKVRDVSGKIEIINKATNTSQEYTLKPLRELYGKGTGLDSVDPTDSQWGPLLMGIEETFCNAYAAYNSLTDGTVIAALDRLCMSPEDAGSDHLVTLVLFSLRFTLSMNDYSRQDVRHCLRKIKQSVIRHNKIAGTRGYLNFITETLRDG